MAPKAPKSSKRSGATKLSGVVKSKKSSSKNHELSAFLFLTVFLAPALSVAVVGSYGFVIWIYQLIAGPPGAP